MLRNIEHNSAMARFLFHLHELGSVLADEEGQLLPNLQDATMLAIEIARDIVSADAKAGLVRLGGHIEIENTDNGGRTVVPFGMAVQILA